MTSSARRIMSLLDLTELSATAGESDIETLCQRAVSAGVAAVCVYPRHVALARALAPDVRVATVVNFPSGDLSVGVVFDEVSRALDDGADEIDAVLPWHALQEGDRVHPVRMLDAVRDASEGHVLKVIVESGGLPDLLVRSASMLAVACGADFVKTSTGKTGVGATRESVEAMLEVVRSAGRLVGVKPSGGIKTFEQAAMFVGLAEAALGPVTPASFRLGASSLYDELAELVSKETAGA